MKIRIGCPAGESSCSGTVTLRTNAAVSSAAAAAAAAAAANKKKLSDLTLASGRFTVPGGGVKTITLHLSARARVLLARVHLLRVRATVLARDPAGATHTGQAIVTLHAPRSRRHTG